MLGRFKGKKNGFYGIISLSLSPFCTRTVRLAFLSFSREGYLDKFNYAGRVNAEGTGKRERQSEGEEVENI